MPPQLKNGPKRCALATCARFRAPSPRSKIIDAEAEELLRQLFPHTGKAYLIGITGAPGTGKSTLVDRLAAHYRSENEAVGVIAVDPTSPIPAARF